MAKAIMGKDKAAVEEIKELAKAPVPEISFTESEVQAVADFINFVYTQCGAHLKFPELKKISNMFGNMHAHVSKIEKYIFEHKRVVAAKKAVE